MENIVHIGLILLGMWIMLVICFVIFSKFVKKIIFLDRENKILRDRITKVIGEKDNWASMATEFEEEIRLRDEEKENKK